MLPLARPRYTYVTETVGLRCSLALHRPRHNREYLSIPILQQRGLFRIGYEGHTLRDHYGLKHPANSAA